MTATMMARLRNSWPLALLVLLLAGTATAQTHTFYIGAKGGLNISDYRSSDGFTPVRAGFNAGLSFTWMPLRWVGLRTELMAHQKGTDFAAFGYSSDYYLELPITPTFVFLKGKIRPSVFAGIAPAVYVGGDGSPNDRLDLGVPVGAGVQFRIFPALWLTLDARHTFGLVPINSGGSYRQSNTSICAGVLFGMGKTK